MSDPDAIARILGREPTEQELDGLADVIDEHVGEGHHAMERAAWAYVARALGSRPPKGGSS